MRRLRLAIVLALGTTLLAVPAASAADEIVFPAGQGCSFDVLAEPADRNPPGIGTLITLTNLDTGATYLQFSRHPAVSETYDPDTNLVTFHEVGRVMYWFSPGDEGPNGTVEWPGALVAFTGSVRSTYYADTNVTTSFSYEGTYIDLCAELAS